MSDRLQEIRQRVGVWAWNLEQGFPSAMQGYALDDMRWLLAELDVARVRNERLAKRLAEQVPWEDAR